LSAKGGSLRSRGLEADEVGGVGVGGELGGCDGAPGVGGVASKGAVVGVGLGSQGVAVDGVGRLPWGCIAWDGGAPGGSSACALALASDIRAAAPETKSPRTTRGLIAPSFALRCRLQCPACMCLAIPPDDATP
jgi:hypothetical protein